MSRPIPQSKHVLHAVCLTFLMAFASNGHAETVAQHETFIVGFSDTPLVTYDGEIRSIPAPPRKGEGRGRIDVSSPEAKAYVNVLRGRQADKVAGMGKALGRQVQPLHSMQHAFNGVIVEMTLEEASALRDQPGVVLVEPYQEFELGTDTGPQRIGAPEVWRNGTGLPPGLTAGPSIPGGHGAKSSVKGKAPAPAKPGARGEGVVFGIVDSGINFGSPSFAEVDMDGYRHTNPLGKGNYLGTCAPGGIDEGRCNAKLIGGYDFICTLTPICEDLTLREFPGFSDENGHGSHVASTAAGNRRLATFRGNDVKISGVAPRANIIAYDACYTNAAGQGLCPNVSTLAAINQAVADGVDVINFSIGGGQFPWSEANSLAFLAASDAGVFVSASAGNSGPGAATLSNVQPWVSSVANAQHGRGVFNQLLLVTGPGTPPADLQEILLTPGASGVAQAEDFPGTTPLVVSPGIDSANDGCAAFPADTFAGAIAVIRRGTCSFSIKTNNAAASGAIAVVIANNAPGTLSPSVPGTTIPAYLASQADSNALRDFAATNPGVTAAIPVAARQFPNTPDALAALSSRGPSGFDYIKPDITGPGVDILAAYAGSAPTGSEDIVNTLSGTSMSSPHNAGAAGLLKQLHPDWTPAEIKSALMMTAAPTVLLEDESTPAGPFAGGAGRIQVDAAAKAGLVLGESTENYLAANPATGGDPSALNLPSLAQSRCIGACTFERTFRATRANQRNWDARIEGLAGFVDQPRFNLGAKGMGTLRVTIDTSAFASDGSWHFGTLVLTPRGKTNSPVLRLPIAVSVPPPEVRLSGTEVSLTLPAGVLGSTSVEVSNNGGPTLDYFIQASGFATRGVLDQPRGAVLSGTRSAFIASLGIGLYAADDFTLADTTSLTSVRTEGFTLDAAIAAGASAITWSIFPDAGGTPAGNPETSPGAAAWRYSAAPNSPGVTATADGPFNVITLNLAAAGQGLELPPGTYWLVVHTTTQTVPDSMFWFFSNTGSGYAPRTVFPASTGTNWTANPNFAGLSAQINGAVSCASPSWVTSVRPSSGSLRFGDSDTLSIRVNTAGLAPGAYSAFVCVASNDPVTPQAIVRVVLNVQ